MREVAVRCERLTKWFGETCAVDHLNFAVAHGEIVVLLGPSGSGKTTTLRLIAGFEVPEAGTVDVGGRRVAAPGVHVPPERRRVGMVFQNYALFPHLSAWDNVAFGLPRRRNRSRRARVEKLLRLAGLQRLADRYPHELSGGEQQRVALARTLAPNPEVVLLDEPFSNLDAELRRQMRSEVRELLDGLNSTALLVTHDQEEAFDMGDRIAVLNQGHLEQLGTPEEVYVYPATRFVAEFIGRSDLLSGRRCSRGIRTEIGIFPLEDDPNWAADEWEVVIRPEIVEIEPDPEGEAVVVACRFTGGQKLYCLELPSGQRIHSLQPSTLGLREGDRVCAKVPRGKPICFPIHTRQTGIDESSEGRKEAALRGRGWAG